MKQLLLIIVSMIHQFAFAQGSIGINTNTPDNSAALEIKSDSKGLLIPRLTTPQRNNIDSPATGLLVFDINKHCIYMYDGSLWLPLSTGSQNDVISQPKTAPTRLDQSGFGCSVSLSGNYAAIGSYSQYGPDRIDTVYIFLKTNGQWQQKWKVTATGQTLDEGFGQTVAISNDYLLVGAKRKTGMKGVVYVFHFNGNNWVQETTLKPAVEQLNSYFGGTIAFRGTRALIGAKWYNGGQGTVFCFERYGNGWQQVQQLNGVAGSYQFGDAISFSNNNLLIGSENASVDGYSANGLVCYYKRINNSWVAMDTLKGVGDGARLGRSVAATDTWMFASTTSFDGIVLCYLNINNQLVQKMQLFAPESAATNDFPNFGQSVYCYDKYLVVGAPGYFNEYAIPGRVYVYKMIDEYSDSEKWGFHKMIVDKSGTPVSNNSELGEFCALNSFDLLIGNPKADHYRGKVLFLDLE